MESLKLDKNPQNIKIRLLPYHPYQPIKFNISDSIMAFTRNIDENNKESISNGRFGSLYLGSVESEIEMI